MKYKFMTISGLELHSPGNNFHCSENTVLFPLHQWFLIFLEVLNPTSSIDAFIEPFLVGKIKSVLVNFIIFTLLLKISCHRTPETDSQKPWGLIVPRLRTTGIALCFTTQLNLISSTMKCMHTMFLQFVLCLYSLLYASSLFRRLVFIPGG